MRFFTPILILFYSHSVFSQTLTTERYQNSMFNAQVINDVKYGAAPQWVWPYWNIDLNLNIHVPDADYNMNRPVIIFAHAGGFINGSKDVDNMGAICDTFARKGFVTATIDYRKGFDPLDAESAERAVYRGIQDGKAAVRFFKENWNVYNIDTNNIFFGGMSAGGFIALHVAYMDKEIERPNSTYGGGTVNDLGCLDCAGNNYPHSSKVKGILDFWGAVSDTTLIEPGDVPVMMMHGTQDPTVPYNSGHPFGLSTLPVTYGALPIKNQCDAVGVPYQHIINDMDLHMMDSSSNGTWDPAPNEFWGDTLLPFTKNFIYELIEPNTQKISPDTVYLGLNEIANFQVSNDTSSTYLWGYDNSSIVELANNNTSTIELQFVTPGTYEVNVIEFNHLLAAGDTLTFVAEVSDDLGIDPGLQNYTLQLYPNPTTDELNIQAGHQINKVALYDLRGNLIKEQLNASNKAIVDVSTFSKGVYVVTAYTEFGVKQSKVSIQ